MSQHSCSDEQLGGEENIKEIIREVRKKDEKYEYEAKENVFSRNSVRDIELR